MISTVYSERSWVRWWISLLFLAVIGSLSAALVVQTILGIPLGSKPAPDVLLLFLDFFFIILYLVLSRLEIRIDSDMVRVTYGIISKKIPIIEIISCETTTAGFWVYGGVGIRYGTDGSVAFTTSFGNAVKIIRNKGRPFVFSTKKPHQVAELINTLVRHKY